ncbi:MAG: hypothetical protein ABIR51_00295 [Sphingomicrobium sp.]
MDGRTGSDSDRLPWLEPYREPRSGRAPRPPVPTPSVRVPLWLLGAVGAGALVLGGYWAGRLGPSSAPRSTVTAPLPPATQPGSSAPASTLAYPPVAVLADPPSPPPVSQLATRRQVESVRPHSAKRRAAATQRKAVHHQVRRAVRHTAKARPKPPRRPRFVLNMSPPPVAGRPGQVIELGRFISPRAADAKWSNAVWRYPYLGRLTKVVTPTSQGPGRRPVYALRLGAGSHSHAKILCRNLRRIGYPCAVV